MGRSGAVRFGVDISWIDADDFTMIIEVALVSRRIGIEPDRKVVDQMDGGGFLFTPDGLEERSTCSG